MSSLRLEIEQAMGLKFPERNGEALVRFEESLEIPRSAENLMRGFYKNPERVRSGFQSLHVETASVLELLLPRRSRLREWAEEPPERPQEAEAFLKETGEELNKKQQRLFQVEKELLNELKDNTISDIFPIPLSAFGSLNLREPGVKLYLRPLGRLAEISQLNPEQLRQAVRVHYLFILLMVSGNDLDGQSYVKGAEDPALHMLAGAFSWRFLKQQSAELVQCYQEWLNAWGGKKPPSAALGEGGAEKLRAAMIFWRRQTQTTWEECWQAINKLERTDEGEGETVFKVQPFRL